MASYGIPSAGATLSATENADTIAVAFNQTAEASAIATYGLGGADVISFAAIGESVIGSSNAAGTVTIPLQTGDGGSGATKTASASIIVSGALVGLSSTYQYTQTYTGKTSVSGASTTITVGGSASTAAFLTSTRSFRYIKNSTIDGGAGNDAIYLGNQVIEATATTFNGGLGDDTIGSWTYNDNSAASAAFSTAVTVNAASFNGGAGNDVIDLNFGTAGLVKSTTIQGGLGLDTITFSADNNITASANYIFGGGDNDQISAHYDGNALNDTIAGGGGADVIAVEVAGTASSTQILGDAFNSMSDFDGADTITFSAANATAVTIQGMGGNDSISATVDAGGGLTLTTNAGNDSVFFSGDFNSSTIQLGGGSDYLLFSGDFAQTDLVSSTIYGGGDNDTIVFANQIGSGAGYDGGGTALTVYGGAGADIFSADNTNVSGSVFTFGYASAGDSTLTAMDTIAFIGSTTEGAFRFTYEPGSTDKGTFSATYASSTDGVVTFTSTYAASVTARAEYIDASMTTAGSTVTFKDGAGINYLFVQGATDADNLVVAVGDAANSKTITVSASTAQISLTFSAE